MMKFLVFDYFPPVVTAVAPAMPSLAVQLVSGGVAGVVSTVVSQPGDAILTRMAQGGDDKVGVLSAANSLWRGDLPTTEGDVKEVGGGEATASSLSSSSLSSSSSSASSSASALEPKVSGVPPSGAGAFFVGVGSRSLWAGCVIAGQFLLYDLFKSQLGVAASDLQEVFDVFGTLQ